MISTISSFSCCGSMRFSSSYQHTIYASKKKKNDFFTGHRKDSLNKEDLKKMQVSRDIKETFPCLYIETYIAHTPISQI